MIFVIRAMLFLMPTGPYALKKQELRGTIDVDGSVLEQDQPEQQKRQPDLNATSLFDAHSLILINNVKNLVILIPNQGHHGPGEQDEARFIEQSFVPENTVISRGTNVIWFNDVVGHEHDLVVTDNATGQNVFQTG